MGYIASSLLQIPPFIMAAFDNISEGVLWVNTRAEIIAVNKACCNVLGMPEKELLGNPLYDLMDTAYRQLFDDKWGTLQKGQVIKGAVFAHFKTEQTRKIQFKGVPFVAENVHLVLIQDVSEKYLLKKSTLLSRRAFAGIRQSNTLEGAVQSLARIIIRFSGWNAIEIRMPDIKGKEMVMASGFQKRSGPVQATFFKKTTREVQVDELRLWFEQHRMMPVCLNTAKTMETCGNGKLIVAGNHFKTVLAVPVVDKEDNSFIAAIFLLDTKEHPRNNDIKIILSHISALLGGALHKKAIQQELLNVFNHSADLIAVQDMDGRFISVNAACNNILGYSEAVLLQKRLTDLVHPDDHGLTSSAFELLKQQEQLTYENRIQSADARYKLIEWVAVSDVTIGKVFSIGRDKTDLSHTREKLRKISWSHSHIIRSPLANIIGMLHLIQQEKLSYDEKTASYLQLLEQQAQEMDTAIRNAVYDDDTAQQL